MFARRKSLLISFSALVIVAAFAATNASAAAPTGTTTTLVISPNPVAVGDPSPTITATTVITSSSVLVTEGGLSIDRLVLVDPITLVHQPVACGTIGGTFEQVAKDGVGPDFVIDGTLVDTTADTSVAGLYGYRAHYVPAGGTGLAQSQSGCFNLEVTAGLCPASGFTIVATASAGNGDALPGQTWTGGFEITIANCTGNLVPGVTAQGGSSGWTTVTVVSADTGLSGIKTTKGKTSTQIIQWNIGDMAAGAVAKIDVSESGFVKPGTPSGTVFYLNGPWSALSGGVKTEYTERITITVP
jgi:hypothetical protein